MSRRLAVVLVALSLSCTRTPAPPAASVPVVAKVVGLRGSPVIISGSVNKSATIGLMLQESDQLSVPEKALLVLELDNGYVVLVDEDQRLGVKDLALLGAAKAKASFEDQIAALVATRQLLRESDRVIGFPSQRLAADSAAAVNTSDNVATRDAPTKADSPGTIVESVKHKGMPATKAPPAVPDALVKMLEVGPCLSSHADALLGAQRRATYVSDRVKVRIEHGVVTRIGLASALPLPECLSALVGKPLEAQDGLYEVEVKVGVK